MKLLGIARRVMCALFDHSAIEDSFMGYHHCARCEALLGDSLGGAYQNERVVGLNHDCETCVQNYAKLTWRDKFLTPTPLVAKSPAQREEAKQARVKAKAWLAEKSAEYARAK